MRTKEGPTAIPALRTLLVLSLALLTTATQKGCPASVDGSSLQIEISGTSPRARHRIKVIALHSTLIAARGLNVSREPPTAIAATLLVAAVDLSSNHAVHASSGAQWRL